MTQCPLCKASTHQTHARPYHWRETQEVFTVLRCDSCGFLFTENPPSASEIGRYYPKEDYISHTDSKKGLFNRIYAFVKQYMFVKKMRLVKRFKRRGVLVDYGAGTGAWVHFAQQNGYSAKGYEIDQSARETGKNQYNVSLQDPELFHENAEESIEVLTLWHVLEHLYDPLEKMKMFHGKLSRNGILILAQPNPHSWDAKKFGDHWAAWDVPIHLSHFTAESIRDLAERNGFELIETQGMPFDAYYVCMLSNENKYGKKKFMRSIVQGIRSNFHGLKTGEYSSRIYVLRKRP